MDLKLDFVGERIEDAPPAQDPAAPVEVNGLKLSFIQPMSVSNAEREAIAEPGNAAAMTEAIIDRQESGGFPQGARPPMDFSEFNWRDPSTYGDAAGKVVDRLATTVTGSDRDTPASQNLPELAELGVHNFLGKHRVEPLIANQGSKLGSAMKALHTWRS
jgi:hypothetical protein